MTEKAAIYTRYSPRPTKRDLDKHESIETQRDRIERYARFRGLEIVREFSDPLVSARKNLLEERTGGRRMLAYVKRYAIKHIIVQKYDRIFRRGVDGMTWLERWRRRHISLHLADEGGNSIDSSTANGWLMMWIKAGFAQFEPMQTAERTGTALRRYQSNGKRVSRVLPYGYMIDPTSSPNGASGIPSLIVECPEEQETIAQMLAWRAQGFGKKSIAKMLMSAGILCRGSSTWHVTTVGRIFARLTSSGASTAPARSLAAP